MEASRGGGQNAHEKGFYNTPPSLENTLFTPIFTERYRIPILGGSLEHDVHMWREKDKSIF